MILQAVNGIWWVVISRLLICERGVRPTPGYDNLDTPIWFNLIPILKEYSQVKSQPKTWRIFFMLSQPKNSRCPVLFWWIQIWFDVYFLSLSWHWFLFLMYHVRMASFVVSKHLPGIVSMSKTLTCNVRRLCVLWLLSWQKINYSVCLLYCTTSNQQ